MNEQITEEEADRELAKLREQIVQKDLELSELQRRYRALTGQNYKWFKYGG